MEAVNILRNDVSGIEYKLEVDINEGIKFNQNIGENGGFEVVLTRQ